MLEYEELISRVVARAGVGRETALKVLDSLFDELAVSMPTEDYIALREDFGGFTVKINGGNPAGKTEVQYTKEHRTPFFKVSPVLKKKLRQSDGDYIRMLRERGAGKLADQLENQRRVNEQP